MSDPRTPPRIEIVCQAPPDRLNEDAWLVMEAGPLGDRVVFAAIDGATTRLTPPPLRRYLDRLPVPLTPAALAARITRDSLARQIASELPPTLRALVVGANRALREVLIEIFGALELDALGFPAEVYESLAGDPRLVRLGLPACVLTLAAYDPAAHALHYAHLGDTSLLVAYQDGRFALAAGDHGSDIGGAIKGTVLDLRHTYPELSLRELLQQPEIRRLVVQGGLRHNYVDEHGLPQPNQGTGVIDGLPELRYFVQTGELALEGVAFVCAMTDGLEWPASASEVFADTPQEAARLKAERRAEMAALLDDLGLRGYLDRLWALKAEDADHERYPRMKTHDDATGVLLRFE